MISSIYEMTNIRVYSIAGQMVQLCNNLHSTIEQVNLESGVYLIDITTINGSSRHKVIVF